MGTAFQGGGQFGLLSHSLDSPSRRSLSFLYIRNSPFSPFQTARIVMALHVLLFLLVFFLIPFLVLLWRFYWPPLQPSHFKAGAVRTTVCRLLKPRTPLDCPSCRLSCSSSQGVRSSPT